MTCPSSFSMTNYLLTQILYELKTTKQPLEYDLKAVKNYPVSIYVGKGGGTITCNTYDVPIHIYEDNILPLYTQFNNELHNSKIFIKCTGGKVSQNIKQYIWNGARINSEICLLVQQHPKDIPSSFYYQVDYVRIYNSTDIYKLPANIKLKFQTQFMDPSALYYLYDVRADTLQPKYLQ